MNWPNKVWLATETDGKLLWHSVAVEKHDIERRQAYEDGFNQRRADKETVSAGIRAGLRRAG